MPGPGSKGIGDTAIRNYDKWKEIRLQMDTIAENKPVDTSLELFDKTFQYPFFVIITMIFLKKRNQGPFYEFYATVFP